MDITNLVDLGREPAFPVHPLAYGLEQEQATEGYDIGRVVLSFYDGYAGTVNRDVLERAEPNDIVFIPLYGGKPSMRIPDRWVVHDLSIKFPSFDENVAIIKELAPRVKGILVGNCGPEASFKEKWLEDQSQPRSNMSKWMCELADEAGGIIVEAGGRPVYGTIDWDIAIDYTYGDAMFRDKVNEQNGIQICFCGYELFGMFMHCPEMGNIVPHPNDPAFYPCCPQQEPMPKPLLQEYLRGGEFWTGLNGIEGLVGGNDIQLAGYGFKEGVVGFDYTTVKPD